MKIDKIINAVNLPRHMANHVVGKQHTVRHRRIAGVIVMAVGVTLAHAAAHIGNVLIALSGDLIGYSIHATGFLPFVHEIESLIEDKNNDCTTC